MTELLARIAAEIKNLWAERLSSHVAVPATLFAGPAGTGKTAAAQALAHELGLDLRRVDLSHIVSQYVDETEKALDRIFAAAAEGGEVLLLDEADALLGKRTNIKDSHDRYANIEIAYLLAKIEAHHGPVILATNRKAALDAAFVRRLRLVEFRP